MDRKATGRGPGSYVIILATQPCTLAVCNEKGWDELGRASVGAASRAVFKEQKEEWRKDLGSMGSARFAFVSLCNGLLGWQNQVLKAKVSYHAQEGKELLFCRRGWGLRDQSDMIGRESTCVFMKNCAELGNR